MSSLSLILAISSALFVAVHTQHFTSSHHQPGSIAVVGGYPGLGGTVISQPPSGHIVSESTTPTDGVAGAFQHGSGLHLKDGGIIPGFLSAFGVKGTTTTKSVSSYEGK